MTSAPKCARCSHEILDGDLVTYRNGVWFHPRCWHVLATDEHIRESRQRAEQARQLLGDGKQHVEGARETLDRMLCVVCGTPITKATSWIRSDDRPTHTACAP